MLHAEAAPANRDDLGRRIDAYLNELVRARGFSSYVPVAKDGRVVPHEGYGLANDESGEPIAKDIVFGVASLSKQCTAAAVLKLEEQGRLSVRDRISEHLDDVPGDKAGVEIRHLLTHTSGFTENRSDGDFVRMDREEALHGIFSTPLAREPGTAHEYWDSGFTVAAASSRRSRGGLSRTT